MTLPFAHQLKMARAAHRFGGRCLFAADPGTGKSFGSILFAQRHPEAKPIVVVCPAHLKWAWDREFRVHANTRCEILEGTRPTKNNGVARAQVFIVNYDIIGQRRGEHNGTGWLPWLKALKPQLVVIDESHFLGSKKSLRTKSVRELCQGVPNVLALSGTPLVNRPAELWPTLNILRPDLYPSFWRFAHDHCNAHMGPYGWRCDGATNLDALHRKLENSLMCRLRREDVLGHIPQKRRMVVPLPLSDRAQYDHAMEDFIGWLREHRPDRVRKAKKAAVTKIGYVLRLIAQLKMQAVDDWIKSFLQNSDDKLCIFGVHIDVIRNGLYKRHEKVSTLIDGSVSKRDRHVAVERFVKSPKTRLLFGNIKAGGTGWSATGINKTAFVELEWAPGHHLQAEDRTTGINRGKEGESSENYYLLGADTLEIKLLELLIKKSKIASKVLDGQSCGSFDVIEDLTEHLLSDDKHERDLEGRHRV